MAKYVIDSRAEPIDFECSDDALRRTLQNCKNLLRCWMGELPYDRKRGLNPAIYDMGLTELNQILLQEVDRVLGWEPDARAVSAAAALDENGETVITVVVEINL